MWKCSCSKILCRNIFMEWDYPWNSFMADDLWPLMQKKVRLSQSMKGLTALKATTFIKRFGMQLLANYLRAIKNWGTYTYNVTVKKNESYRTHTEEGHSAFAPCRYLRRAISQNNQIESNKHYWCVLHRKVLSQDQWESCVLTGENFQTILVAKSLIKKYLWNISLYEAIQNESAELCFIFHSAHSVLYLYSTGNIAPYTL